MRMIEPGKQSDEWMTVNLAHEPMVNWFNPAQLVPTALRALISALFGAYADSRDMQAALDPGAHKPVKLDYSAREALWFDYVSDLGDGWNATYSVAWLLAQRALTIDGKVLPRGAVLLMGGDQVYPTASRANYARRCIGPYTAALPHCEQAPPDLLALPGNHDWYDGLSSFLRQFCQGRWIGGRRTVQARSYFAVHLPHGWWLWAVDIQLTADIDEPQKQYFRHFAEQLRAGDQVILCCPVSSWIADGDTRNTPDAGPDADGTHPNLVYLESLIHQHEAQVSLTLAGDLHFYAHYQQPGGKRHKITAGGGGAFLHGTHDLPPKLKLKEDGEDLKFTRASAFPSVAKSKSMRWHNLFFFAFNPAFCLFLGALYLVFAWLWQSASKNVNASGPDQLTGLMGLLSEAPLSLGNARHVAFPALLRILAHSPDTLLITLLPVVGLLFFAQPGARRWAGAKRFAWGALHGLAHMVLALVLLWVLSRTNRQFFFTDAGAVPWMDLPGQVILFALETVVFGFVCGGALFGCYLLASNIVGGMHDEDMFSSLHSADYKNFLRLHIERDALTIYPIQVERVCRIWSLGAGTRKIASRRSWGIRSWRFRVRKTDERPWFEPASGAIGTGLIEPAIVIPNIAKVEQ